MRSRTRTAPLYYARVCDLSRGSPEQKFVATTNRTPSHGEVLCSNANTIAPDQTQWSSPLSESDWSPALNQIAAGEPSPITLGFRYSDVEGIKVSSSTAASMVQPHRCKHTKIVSGCKYPVRCDHRTATADGRRFICRLVPDTSATNFARNEFLERITLGKFSGIRSSPSISWASSNRTGSKFRTLCRQVWLLGFSGGLPNRARVRQPSRNY